MFWTTKFNWKHMTVKSLLRTYLPRFSRIQSCRNTLAHNFIVIEIILLMDGGYYEEHSAAPVHYRLLLFATPIPF